MAKKPQNTAGNRNEDSAPQERKWPDKAIIRYVIRALVLLIVFAWALVNLDAVLRFLGTVLALRHTGRVSFAGTLRQALFQQHSNGRRITLIKNAIAPPIRNGVNSASTLPRKRKTASRFTSAHANTISSKNARVI